MGKHPHHALTDAKIRKLKEPGFYADGNCLFLRVEPSGSKHWIVRTTINDKRCDVGAGSLRYISLKEARDKAIDIVKAARSGGDPIAERREEKRAKRIENSMPTFETATRTVYAEKESTFSNAQHRRQWIQQLEKLAFPHIGNLRVDRITTADLLKVLTPIWLKNADIARRIKQRMQLILDWSKAKDYRTGDNPADGIEEVLPKQSKKNNHYAALPYKEVPAFVQNLQKDEGVSSRLALEFLILTAARTGEVIKATWKEINWEDKIWTRPAEHMKMREPHRVPLSSRAIEILEAAKKITDGSEYLFPGMRAGEHLSNMAMLATLERMGRTDITNHGFRSSFRDWCEEKSGHRRHAIEMALAHTVKGAEGDYLRTDMLEERRELMQMWARFAATVPGAKVVRIGR